jgi:hypothetical protein
MKEAVLVLSIYTYQPVVKDFHSVSFVNMFGDNIHFSHIKLLDPLFAK